MLLSALELGFNLEDTLAQRHDVSDGEGHAVLALHNLY